MKTRIKKINAVINEVRQERFCVQELGSDRQFRTIEGGCCKTLEDAQKVRTRYKRVAKDVEAFNRRFQHQTLTMPVDYQKIKSHEEGRD